MMHEVKRVGRFRNPKKSSPKKRAGPRWNGVKGIPRIDEGVEEINVFQDSDEFLEQDSVGEEAIQSMANLQAKIIAHDSNS